MQFIYSVWDRLGGSKRSQLGGDGPWRATHQHSKGGHYRVLGRGVLEADETPMVIYDDKSGKIWIRPVVEFDDGRFAAVPEG